MTQNNGLDEFDEIMRDVPDNMVTEPGFISARVYVNSDDPNSYVLTEVWASRQLHTAHFDRIVASGDWAHIKSLVRNDPVPTYFDEIAR